MASALRHPRGRLWTPRQPEPIPPKSSGGSRDGMEKGLVTADTLRAAARRHSNQHIKDVRQMIEDAISNVTA